MKPAKVLLVDDHVLFREGLAALLVSQKDLAVVGEASDGEEAVKKARQLKPELILMDIHMPGGDGLKATRIIKGEMPETKVVILTVSDDDEDLFEAIKSGAAGYILKNVKSEGLFEMLRGAMEGKAALSPLLAAKVLEEFARQGKAHSSRPEDHLTDREKEVLQLVVSGATNKKVADALVITEGTVKRHLHNILGKLHLQNRVQLATYGVRRGLVPPPSPDGT